MKRSISLVLCLAMLVSVFSCLGVTASAAGNAQDFFTVKAGEFKNNKITYTVYLNKGVSMIGSIIYAKFDTDVLAIDEKNTGAYMTTDSYGDEIQNINGVYEQGYSEDADDEYSVAHVYGTESDYKPGSNKPYMQFTFKAIDGNRPETKIKFYCYEFNSQNSPENNIDNGSDSLITTSEIKTLGTTVYKAIENTKDGVVLTWNKTVGADEYEISKNGKVVKTVSSSVTSFEDNDVENNVKYTYSVRAKNEAGYDYAKEDISIRYMVAPSKITLKNEDGKVVVSWSKVEGATAYRVYRRIIDTDGYVCEWEPFKKITATSYEDKTAKSGVEYEYAVRVYSDDGNSDLYSEKGIVYLDVPEFSVKATTSGVSISWDKVDGATGYKIFRKVKGGKWKTIKTTSAKTTSYTDKDATSGKKIYYAVKAINGSYISEYDTHTVTYIKTPTVSIKNITSGVRVSWKKVSGATSYEVYRKAGSAKSWKKIKTTKSTAYTDKSVKSGTTYKYCIRAIGSSAKSAYGGSSYEKIRFLAAPELEKIKSTKSGVTIYWDDVKGASKYHIYRKTGSGDFKLLKTVSGKSTVKYLDKSAKKGKTYSYRVYAGYSSYKSSYESTLKIKDKY